MPLFSKPRKLNRVIITGLQGSGKTTLMYKLTNQPLPNEMTPTACEKLEKFVIGPQNRKIVFSEQKQVTPDCNAIVYLLNNSHLDPEFEHFKQVIENEKDKPLVPLLVILNHDLEENVETDTLANNLLPLLGTQRSFAVISSNVKSDNLDGILSWVEHKLALY